MPRLPESTLQALADDFRACKDVYLTPAWRKLENGLDGQIKATEAEIRNAVILKDRIDEKELYELRGYAQAVYFLRDLMRSGEAGGAAAIAALNRRVAENHGRSDDSTTQ